MLCSRASGLAGWLQSVRPSSTTVQSCKCCLVASNASPRRCLATEPVWLCAELNALSLPGLCGSSESTLSLSRVPFFPFQIEGLGHTPGGYLSWHGCSVPCLCVSCSSFPLGLPTPHVAPLTILVPSTGPRRLAWYPESRYPRAQHLLGTYIPL